MWMVFEDRMGYHDQDSGSASGRGAVAAGFICFMEPFVLCWVGATVSATLTKVNLSKDSVRMKHCPLFAGGTFIIFYL